jgi:uncharacterized protein (TIGR02598 family)
MKTTTAHFRKSSSGFTLVEVIMALGIFSFAIVAIIGLMGTGLNVSKDSIQDSTFARIYEQVVPIVQSITDNATVNVSTNFTSSGQISKTSDDALYTVNLSKLSVPVSGPVAGLRANRVWKVTIERYGVANSLMATNFVMLSKDPKDL